MISFLLMLACGGGDSTETTDTPNVTATIASNGTPQGTPSPMGADGAANGPTGMGPEGQMNGPNNGGQMPEGQMNGPNNGNNIGAAVPPEDGQNIGDPNVPPDTINQTVGKDGITPPQPMEMGSAEGAQQEPKKKPPTFIYNAHSEDSGPLYKAADGSCFVRKEWNQPNNGTMGEIEARDCPQQMASDAWNNCAYGRLVKHNVGDKEGTCECEPIESGAAKTVDCP